MLNLGATGAPSSDSEEILFKQDLGATAAPMADEAIDFRKGMVALLADFNEVSQRSLHELKDENRKSLQRMDDRISSIRDISLDTQKEVSSKMRAGLETKSGGFGVSSVGATSTPLSSHAGASGHQGQRNLGLNSPFAAELGVINQRERDFTPLWRGQTNSSTTSSFNRHDAVRPKAATFDGKDDWETFAMPFQRRAERSGWSNQEKVDHLHECLRGSAVRYVCSLPYDIRES
jgi:hypothetical protein